MLVFQDNQLKSFFVFQSEHGSIDVHTVYTAVFLHLSLYLAMMCLQEADEKLSINRFCQHLQEELSSRRLIEIGIDVFYKTTLLGGTLSGIIGS